MAFFETVLGKCIMTMAIAAVPVVELRGAIPAGIAAGLDPWLACGAAIQAATLANAIAGGILEGVLYYTKLLEGK